MKRLYIDIDTQIDFMSEAGALYVPGAAKIVPNIKALLEKAITDPTGILIGSLDAHEFYSAEFQENGGAFPRHCVRGTVGQLKLPELTPERMLIFSHSDSWMRNHYNEIYRANKGAQGYYFEKDEFSLFSNPGADELISEFVVPEGIKAAEVLIFGVATDFCVRDAAFSFAHRGYKTAVVRDAIAGVEPAAVDDTLHEFWKRGIQLVWTKDVLA